MNTMDLRRTISIVTLAVSFCASASAQPRLPHQPTSEELLRLPEVCQIKLKQASTPTPAGTARETLWVQRLGAANYSHLHHHCYGINYLSRAMVTFDKAEKRFFLTSAIGEFNYVLRHWPADSPLRPEAQALKQQAEMMLKFK